MLDDPEAAQAALDPLRSRLLAALAERPASAAGLAAVLDVPRQKLRYHLRLLEERGLVREVEQRSHGGLTERIFEPSAAAYVVSPAALGAAGGDPARLRDRLSAAYLLAVAGRALAEVGRLARGAARADAHLPTLTVDTALRFGSPAARAAFADELDRVLVDLVARHHDEAAPDGRWYRLVAFSHPRPPEDTP